MPRSTTRSKLPTPFRSPPFVAGIPDGTTAQSRRRFVPQRRRLPERSTRRAGWGSTAPAVRDRRAPVAAEGLRPEAHARRSLPTLVLGPIDHRHGALHELGIEAVVRELFARAI